MAKYSIRFNDTTYDSNEQAFQWTKATTHGKDEIADEIKGATESFDIYYAGAEIVTTEEWKQNAVELLATLVILK